MREAAKCTGCGTSVDEVALDSASGDWKLVPITIPGRVENGRCLSCNPSVVQPPPIKHEEGDDEKFDLCSSSDEEGANIKSEVDLHNDDGNESPTFSSNGRNVIARTTTYAKTSATRDVTARSSNASASTASNTLCDSQRLPRSMVASARSRKPRILLKNVLPKLDQKANVDSHLQGLGELTTWLKNRVAPKTSSKKREEGIYILISNLDPVEGSMKTHNVLSVQLRGCKFLAILAEALEKLADEDPEKLKKNMEAKDCLKSAISPVVSAMNTNSSDFNITEQGFIFLSHLGDLSSNRDFRSLEGLRVVTRQFKAHRGRNEVAKAGLCLLRTIAHDSKDVSKKLLSDGFVKIFVDLLQTFCDKKEYKVCHDVCATLQIMSTYELRTTTEHIVENDQGLLAIARTMKESLRHKEEGMGIAEDSCRLLQNLTCIALLENDEKVVINALVMAMRAFADTAKITFCCCRALPNMSDSKPALTTMKGCGVWNLVELTIQKFPQDMGIEDARKLLDCMKKITVGAGEVYV